LSQLIIVAPMQAASVFPIFVKLLTFDCDNYTKMYEKDTVM